MASSFRVRTEGGFKSFDDWNQIWHKNFHRRNPNYLKDDMYMNGQYDEFPYIIWEEDQLVDEFDFHDELVDYEQKGYVA